jgi:hypothetical protein
MTEKRTFVLRNEAIRQRAADHIFTVPDGFTVTVSEPLRNLEMNAKFHAICHELEKLGVLWFGKPRKAAEWKVLLVSGHAIATKEGSDIIPGLEGEFVNIRESTALMSKSRGSSLIEYSTAFLETHRPVKEHA